MRSSVLCIDRVSAAESQLIGPNARTSGKDFRRQDPPALQLSRIRRRDERWCSGRSRFDPERFTLAARSVAGQGPARSFTDRSWLRELSLPNTHKRTVAGRPVVVRLAQALCRLLDDGRACPAVNRRQRADLTHSRSNFSFVAPELPRRFTSDSSRINSRCEMTGAGKQNQQPCSPASHSARGPPPRSGSDLVAWSRSSLPPEALVAAGTTKEGVSRWNPKTAQRPQFMRL